MSQMAHPEKPDGRKEVYGDPIRFRLAAEFWRIVDDLQPRILAGLEYLGEQKAIDERWIETIQEVGTASLDLKWSIDGFKNLLTKEDGDSIRSYQECFTLAMRRKDRAEVQHGVMEGRAELFARRKLALEDRAIALFYQTMDIRGVAFKNKMWDFSHRPETKAHNISLG